MAVGSIAGSFIGGRLLGVVPLPVLLPLLSVHTRPFGVEGLAPSVSVRSPEQTGYDYEG